MEIIIFVYFLIGFSMAWLLASKDLVDSYSYAFFIIILGPVSIPFYVLYLTITMSIETALENVIKKFNVRIGSSK